MLINWKFRSVKRFRLIPTVRRRVARWSKIKEKRPEAITKELRNGMDRGERIIFCIIV